MSLSKRQKRLRRKGPRRKRMTSVARIASATATSWVQKYSGKNLVHGYRKTFGVDLFCAIRELRVLKVPISLEYENQIRLTIEQQTLQKERKKEAKKIIQSEEAGNWDLDYCGSEYGVNIEDFSDANIHWF